MSKPKLSTHVLDTCTGEPAAALVAELYKQRNDQWIQWHSGVTTGDGRIQFPFSEESLPAAVYKLKFNVEDYFKRHGADTFYPYIEVVFKVESGRHYHVPLLLSQYGYSTYKGS